MFNKHTYITESVERPIVHSDTNACGHTLTYNKE